MIAHAQQLGEIDVGMRRVDPAFHHNMAGFEATMLIVCSDTYRYLVDLPQGKGYRSIKVPVCSCLVRLYGVGVTHLFCPFRFFFHIRPRTSLAA